MDYQGQEKGWKTLHSLSIYAASVNIWRDPKDLLPAVSQTLGSAPKQGFLMGFNSIRHLAQSRGAVVGYYPLESDSSDRKNKILLANNVAVLSMSYHRIIRNYKNGIKTVTTHCFYLHCFLKKWQLHWKKNIFFLSWFFFIALKQ